jgi:hypothetical protein
MINEHTQLVTCAPERRINAVAVAEKAHRALSITANPAEIMQIEAQLDLVERLMRETGFYPLDEIRPVNEARMRARWRLGAALESVVKDKPGPKPQGVTSAGLMQFLKQIELDHQTALEARRIAALPDKNFQEAIEQWRARDDRLHYDDLLHFSKPFWTREKRQETHRRIAEEATAAKIEAPEKFGPFALLYIDPPWTFETYSDLATRLPVPGADRSRDHRLQSLRPHHPGDQRQGLRAVSLVHVLEPCARSRRDARLGLHLQDVRRVGQGTDRHRLDLPQPTRGLALRHARQPAEAALYASIGLPRQAWPP